jgi:hypothetical protein
VGYGTIRFDMEIEHLFKKNCNEVDSIGTMVDEVMVNKHTSPLLLQAIFSHNAKCRYFFSKLFYQIMGVSMK